MSLFYVRLPTGTVPLDEVQKACLARLDFLLRVLECGGDDEALRRLHEEAVQAGSTAEYVLEGGPKDAVSHFTARLCCSQDYDLYDFFCRAEAALFAFRIRSLTEAELCAAFSTTRRHLQRLPTATGSSLVDGCRPWTVLGSVFEQASPRQLAAAICRNRTTATAMPGETTGRAERSGMPSSESQPSGLVLRLPFQDVLRLVAARAVTLSRGAAAVRQSEVAALMADLFERLLADRVSRERARSCATDAGHDQRFVGLMKRVWEWHQSKNDRLWRGWHPADIKRKGVQITCDNVDDASRFFPPCMINLHRTLRLRHRLKHHSRISYSLFLKTIGMPVQEALRFWKGEYSKPCNYSDSSGSGGRGRRDASSAHCTHSWCASGRRYEYGIRHLYGLEGSRRNYRVQSCSYLQDSISCGEEGGCPFEHFDGPSLSRLLSGSGITENQQQAVSSALDGEGGAQRACMAFCCYRSGNLDGQAAGVPTVDTGTSKAITTSLAFDISDDRSKLFATGDAANVKTFTRTGALSDGMRRLGEGCLGVSSTAEVTATAVTTVGQRLTDDTVQPVSKQDAKQAAAYTDCRTPADFYWIQRHRSGT